MSVRTYLAVAVFITATGFVQADDQAELKALADKAAKALGSAEKVKLLDGMTLKGRGTIHVDNMEVPFTFDGAAQGHDRFRLDMEATVNGMPIKVLLVFQGAKGWAKVMDRVEDMPAEVAAAIGKDSYALRLA